MRQVDPAQLTLRPFHLIDREWGLLVTGLERPNLMTVSWGGMGTLWSRPMVTVYVRPVRHSYTCLEAHHEFQLCFLPPAHREALQRCGASSGRDTDKWAAAGLSPVPGAVVAVPRAREAWLALECRVVSTFDVDPARFLDRTIEGLYPEHDYHRAYLGEVVAAFADDRFLSTQG